MILSHLLIYGCFRINVKHIPLAQKRSSFMNILDRVPSILGDQFTEKLVADIDKLLDYVDTYQASSNEKNYISPAGICL